MGGKKQETRLIATKNEIIVFKITMCKRKLSFLAQIINKKKKLKVTDLRWLKHFYLF